MIPNNNLSVLPFYKSSGRQNHRKDYAQGEVFPLITPDRKILPFQIIRNHRANGITQVLLKNFDGSTHLDITSQMLSTGLVIKEYSSFYYDIISYDGVLPMPIMTPEGRYYIEVSDGVERVYSDVFTIVRNLSDYLKITYWDNESLLFDGGRIDFSAGFKYSIYLPTELGRPEYPFSEEVEDRDGFSFVEKQVSEKTFKFNFIAPEYLCDAMRIIRMVDNVEITNKGDTYDADSFLITPKWLEGGYLASVEAEFQCNTIVKKIGQGYTAASLGDFNNDFNNDFKQS